MSRRRWLGLALVLSALLLLAALILAFRDIARAVVTRLAQVLWTVHLLFQSVPRWAWWTTLLAAALSLAARSLAPRRPKRPAGDEEPLPAVGPITAELRYVRLAQQGRYGQWRLAQRLAELAAQALAYRDRIPLQEARQHLRAGNSGLPEGFRRYLQADLGSLGESARKRLALVRRRPDAPRVTESRPQPDQVIAYIEQLLEVER
ncbi:MAG: hypothetical protein GXY76_14175 [Chloroflexi bacterium]|nr:hypothetical protein [Chloroflexota bacterium]